MVNGDILLMPHIATLDRYLSRNGGSPERYGVLVLRDAPELVSFGAKISIAELPERELESIAESCNAQLPKELLNQISNAQSDETSC